MEKSYITHTEDGYRIATSRVSLDSVVYDFLSGLSPESIVDHYDTLTLEQVYGAGGMFAPRPRPRSTGRRGAR